MPNRPPTVSKAEIERTVKGVIGAGLTIARVEVEAGRIVVYTNDSSAHMESDLEAWRRKKNGQS